MNKDKPTSDGPNLVANYKKFFANDDVLRKCNVKLTCEVQEKVARARVEPACLKAVTQELASVRLLLALSRAEKASLRLDFS